MWGLNGSGMCRVEAVRSILQIKIELRENVIPGQRFLGPASIPIVY
jgi:hypothetical protein